MFQKLGKVLAVGLLTAVALVASSDDASADRGRWGGYRAGGGYGRYYATPRGYGGYYGGYAPRNYYQGYAPNYGSPYNRNSYYGNNYYRNYYGNGYYNRGYYGNGNYFNSPGVTIRW